jgi:hypothetical protein
MTRGQRYLAGLVLVQLVLIAAVFWPRGGTAVNSGPLLQNFQADEVVGLVIHSSDGSQVHLSRLGTGWLLPDAGSFPVDETKVAPFLDKLAAVNTSRLVTRTSASQSRLKVAPDNYERKVELELNDGSKLTVYVGSSEGSHATHIRLDGEDAVYLTGELAAADAGSSPQNWIDTTYLALGVDQINTLQVENANGSLSFQKDADGNWSQAGLAPEADFDTGNFTSALGRLASLQMLQPLGTEEKPEYNMSQPTATLTLTSQAEGSDPQTTTLVVGAHQSDPDGYVVKSKSSPYYVSVAPFNLDSFISATAETFVLPPSTPTVLPGGTQPAAP